MCVGGGGGGVGVDSYEQNGGVQMPSLLEPVKVNQELNQIFSRVVHVGCSMQM